MTFVFVSLLSFFICARFDYSELKKQSQTNTLEGGTQITRKYKWFLSRILDDFTCPSLWYLTLSVFWVSLLGIPKTLGIWVQGYPKHGDTQITVTPPPRGKMLATLGERAFQAAAPHLWNELPLQLHTVGSVETFKNSIRLFFLGDLFNNGQGTNFI